MKYGFLVTILLLNIPLLCLWHFLLLNFINISFSCIKILEPTPSRGSFTTEELAPEPRCDFYRTAQFELIVKIV